MAQEELIISKSLFGYRPNLVDKFINDISNSNCEKVKEIKNKIIYLKIENARIKKEMSELRNQVEEQTKSEEFMEFALEKAEELIPLLNELVDKQLFEVSEIYIRQETALNSKIDEFNNTIKNTKEQLNSLLKDVICNSESLGQNMKSVIDKKDSYKCILNKINKTGESKILNEVDENKAENVKSIMEKDIVKENVFLDE
jgi:hypothetical protein